MVAPPLTWLYVPADRPERVEKAIASRAHVVVVDLEDAVAPPAKDAARDGLERLLGSPLGRAVHLRVNGLATAWAEDDLRAAAELAGIVGVELAKTRDPADAETAVARAGGKPVRCLIESARALEHAYGIAEVAGIEGIGLGEVDLAAETGASGTGLDWARARLVNASVAAGLGRPPQGVHPNVADLPALRSSCERGKSLGFLGRAAIHPDQLATIESAYLPTSDEAERARAILDHAGVVGAGASRLSGGALVDAAVIRAAEAVAALADAYGTARA